MKATELIRQLTELVKLHGDREIVTSRCDGESWHFPVTELVTRIDLTAFTETGVCGCPGADVPAFELKT